MPWLPRRHRSPDVRPSAARRGYGRRWRKVRDAWLAEDPSRLLCSDPDGVHGGQPVLMYAIDHIVPHRGDPVKFWDSENNWMSLCESCHNRKSLREQ